MSFRFHRAIPAISIFHNPSSPVSNRALELLRSALSSAPSPGSPGNGGVTASKPLDFNLEVIERQPPTADQVSTLLNYTLISQSGKLKKPTKSSPDLGTFMSAHPSNATSGPPSTASDVVALASKNPNAFKYPLVVNWEDGEVSIGNADGVYAMLENLRKRQDGELPSDGDVFKPKGWLF